MASSYPTTGGTGRGVTSVAITATVSVNGSPAATVEDISITNDAGPVSAVPQTVGVSAVLNTIEATAITVAANAIGVIITPPTGNTVQLYVSNENSTAGSGGVPTYGLKMPLETPFPYTFDLGAVPTFYLKSTGDGVGTDISVNLTWF